MMKMILTLLTCLIATKVFAGIHQAPKSFLTNEGKVVFVDFINADYHITYDGQKKLVNAVSTITFETSEEGMPLFDVVEDPTVVSLNGEVTKTLLISSPDKDTKFRVIQKTISPGLHTLVVHSPISQGVLFSSAGVSSAFWFTDLSERSFLEAYLPSNLEYDQYKMVFNLSFKNLPQQKIYTNGVIKKLAEGHYRIEFPETYNSASVYFQTAPIGRYTELNFIFKSIDGRELPVTTYAANSSTNLLDVKKEIIKSMTKLESQYGPFLHQSLTVFIAGSGGMEYCGATMTSLWALNHELTHSYFARGGLIPANGNSGWLDEAITSWSDEGASSRPDITGMYSNMAGNSQYRRFTHSDAYTYGKAFMAHLNYKFQNSGGLNSFLNELIQKNAFTTLTTEEFIKQISAHYSEDLTKLFKNYTYSSKPPTGPVIERPVHMKMTLEEMREFL